MIPSLHIRAQLLAILATALAYSAVVMLIVRYFEIPVWHIGSEVAAILSVVFSALIVFRNNTANERWWEARKLWGQLINDTRNLAVKAKAFARVEQNELRELGRLLSGFGHSLRLHLYGGCDLRVVPGFADETCPTAHVPGYLAGLIQNTLARWNRDEKLDGTIWLFDQHARALLDICGACERIRNTPLPSSYRALLRWGITLYILFTPWAVLLEMGWPGLLVLGVGFGFMLGIELTAEAIEEPFGDDGDDLPLEDYCRTIDTFVFATLGQARRETIKIEPNALM